MTTLVSTILDAPAPAARASAPRAAGEGAERFADALDRSSDALAAPGDDTAASAAQAADPAAPARPRARRAGAQGAQAPEPAAAVDGALALLLPAAQVPVEAQAPGGADRLLSGQAAATLLPRAAPASLAGIPAGQEAIAAGPQQPALLAPVGAWPVAATSQQPVLSPPVGAELVAAAATAVDGAAGAAAHDFADSLLQQLQLQRPRAADGAARHDSQAAVALTPASPASAQPAANDAIAFAPASRAARGAPSVPAEAPAGAFTASNAAATALRGASDAPAAEARRADAAAPELAIEENSPAASQADAAAVPLAAAPRSEAPGIAAARADVHASRLAPLVGSSEWAPALAQHLVRIDAGRDRQVELHLNPVDLGPLKVTVSISDQSAQVLFVSEHAAVRQAVEAALPQLRASFAENGISLGQASVGAGSGDAAARQAPTGDDRPRGQPPRDGQATPVAEAGQPVAAPRRRTAAGLDTFA